MRFESVTAHAFGPFRDATLELAPGMTLVYGPNEAGKSTWHAATYAALCGMRRTRGAMRVEDREFAERHRPWDGEAWDVSARIELGDGRRIEIRQDLDGKVDCRALDLGAARDVSSDIIHEGSPDGSKWLGLDRRAFLATACIGQAEILSVLDDSSALQEHLQRAAATAGRDETAAAAIDAIARFHRDHVGVDRANARGPLRKARENLERLRVELDEVRRLHDEYLGLIDAAGKKTAERDTLEARRQAAARVIAREEAKKLSARLARVRALAEKFAAGPPPSPTAGIEIASRVAAAIDAWERRPEIHDLEGPTAAEEILALREREEPSAPSGPDAGEASGERLREQARALEEPEPAGDPALAGRVKSARKEVERTRPGERRGVAVAALLGSVAAGIAVGVLGHVEIGLAVGATGLVVAVVLLLLRDSGAHERALAELREAESRYGLYEQTRKAVAARRETARRRVESLGLQPDPARLRALARELEAAFAMLRAAAGECGVAGEEPQKTVAGLRSWLARHGAEADERKKLAVEYRELEIALGGREPGAAIVGMERELSGLEATAASGPSGGGDEPLEGLGAPALLSLEERIRRLEREASGLDGAVRERARKLPSVADAEEAVAEAERELDRVRRLERTLERTRELLQRAEERVHRDIAGELADAVRPWLPRITAGRYRDVAVNAGDLSVRVKDPEGHWREAIRLSHGTTEQIYLLLRVALAEHLIRKGERCPLLLDEVTVQSDRPRTEAILGLLHVLSADRQIVLFTQEEDLREWARVHLTGDRDRLIELAGPVTAAP